MADDQKPQSELVDMTDETGTTGDASKRPPSRPDVGLNGKYSAIAALAAVAGFVGVYMNLPSNGNDKAPRETKTLQVAPTTSSKAGLIAYAKGDMGTFVVKKSPAAISEKLKFTDFTAGDDGVAKTIADWKGKVVLLNLWATWCAPCRKEMPDLMKLDQDLGGADFDLIAISIDRGGPAKPRKFLKQIGAESIGLFQGPSSETSGPLKAFGMPTTLLIDREGRELGRLVGPADWASEDAKALIKAAIAANS